MFWMCFRGRAPAFEPGARSIRVIPIAVGTHSIFLIIMEPSNKHQIAQDPFVFYEQVIPEKLVDLMVEELPKYDGTYAEARPDREWSTFELHIQGFWMYEDDCFFYVYSLFPFSKQRAMGV